MIFTIQEIILKYPVVFNLWGSKQNCLNYLLLPNADVMLQCERSHGLWVQDRYNKIWDSFPDSILWQPKTELKNAIHFLVLAPLSLFFLYPSICIATFPGNKSNPAIMQSVKESIKLRDFHWRCCYSANRSTKADLWNSANCLLDKGIHLQCTHSP